MLLFTFLFFPLLIALFCLKKNAKDFIPPIFCGILLSLICCLIKFFFFHSHRIIPFSFSENFIFLLTRQSLVPFILVFLLFFCFSRDCLQTKINSLCLLELSFYAIFLPYLIVSSSEGVFLRFAIFVKPILFAVSIIQISFSLKNLFTKVQFSLENKVLANSFIVLYKLFDFCLILVYLVFSSVIESLYIINSNLFFVSLLSVLYIIFPIFYVILQKVIFHKIVY